MTELTFFIIIIFLILIETYVLANTKYFWLGGVIPLLGTIGIVYVLVKSQHLVFIDFIIAAIGIIVLLVFWGEGHNRYNKRISKEKNKMLSNDLSQGKN
ncbi:hypothetical protein RD055328_12160 [Companilactobacillus sp. RD055328]|uniref:hypothetical protein n=1 Tax=Companilactobacillus sp. RD055328 TaxID=2916634 RepID=UPI001FC7C621|nr:hypothetical protein [Companilactobacillus sp. RD055328]GKQ43293.1 hypothetical protein RD055328_12160 [Companilactobacillus sp. RD055328]